MVATNLETLRVGEGMLSILLAGGIEPRTAVWAIDALSLSPLRRRLRTGDLHGPPAAERPDTTWVPSQAEQLVRRFNALPDATFPQTRRYAAELACGARHQRFDFALGLLIDNLAQ